MPIRKDSFKKQRTDEYMNASESIVFFLNSNSERAYTSSEIAYETDVNDREILLKVLGDLNKEKKVIERLIFDGKKSQFYYMINEETMKQEQEGDEEPPEEPGDGESTPE